MISFFPNRKVRQLGRVGMFTTHVQELDPSIYERRIVMTENNLHALINVRTHLDNKEAMMSSAQRNVTRSRYDLAYEMRRNFGFRGASFQPSFWSCRWSWPEKCMFCAHKMHQNDHKPPKW
jgi:hypothetical protein